MITKDIEELGKEKHVLETDIAQKEADIKIKNGEIKSLQVSFFSFFIIVNSFLNWDNRGPLLQTCRPLCTPHTFVSYLVYTF
jgi:hypothetical protein